MAFDEIARKCKKLKPVNTFVIFNIRLKQSTMIED